jgi:hypothetical protein
MPVMQTYSPIKLRLDPIKAENLQRCGQKAFRGRQGKFDRLSFTSLIYLDGWAESWACRARASFWVCAASVLLP